MVASSATGHRQQTVKKAKGQKGGGGAQGAQESGKRIRQGPLRVRVALLLCLGESGALSHVPLVPMSHLLISSHITYYPCTHEWPLPQSNSSHCRPPVECMAHGGRSVRTDAPKPSRASRQHAMPCRAQGRQLQVSRRTRHHARTTTSLYPPTTIQEPKPEPENGRPFNPRCRRIKKPIHHHT